MILAGMFARRAAAAPGGGSTLAIAGMAYTNTDVSAGGDTHPITMPSGVAAGDMLVVSVLCSNDRTVTASGWTQFASYYDPDGTLKKMILFYRIATGSEGATVTFTSNVSTSLNALAFRITGAHASTPPEAAQGLIFGVSTYDPPGLTPSWGSAATAWLVVASNSYGSTTVSQHALDAGTQHAGGSNQNFIQSGRVSTAASIDPSPIIMSANEYGITFTIGVRGA